MRKSQEEAKRTKEAADRDIAAAEARRKEIEKQIEREREMETQREQKREKEMQKEREAHKNRMAEADRQLREAKEKEERAERMMREEMERIRQENERMRQEANEGGVWASVGKVRHSSCGQSPLYSSIQLGKEISGSAETDCYRCYIVEDVAGLKRYGHDIIIYLKCYGLKGHASLDEVCQQYIIFNCPFNILLILIL